MPEFYAKFVDVSQEHLFELILAANFMDVKPLLDLASAKVASLIKGKKVEEIRKLCVRRRCRRRARGSWARVAAPSSCASVPPCCLPACARSPALLLPPSTCPPATPPRPHADSFGIKNDFTPEEEALVKDENRWCVGGLPPLR